MTAEPITTHIAPSDLDPAELALLTAITNGYSNAEIAEHLRVGIREVKTVQRRLYARLGFVRRTQAVVWGAERGLYQLGPVAID